MSPATAPSQFTVAILPFGDVSAWQIELTKIVLKYVFAVNTMVLPPAEIPQKCFNSQRNGYEKTELLKFLFLQLPANAQRIVGIIKGVIETEFKDNKYFFSLGCANQNYRAAIYSTMNLTEQQLSQVKNKTNHDFISYHLIVHEFAHTLGIMHCAHPECAMHEGTIKTTLCDNCRRWADRELKVQHGSAEERFSLAEGYFLNDYLPQAISLYREAITLAPREPLYYHSLSTALYRQEQNEEAEEILKLAIKYSDDSGPYVCGLTCLEGMLERAEGLFAKALATTKNQQKMHRLIGQAYREILHDVERASEHYMKYLQLGGNDPDVINWLISRGQLGQN